MAHAFTFPPGLPIIVAYALPPPFPPGRRNRGCDLLGPLPRCQPGRSHPIRGRPLLLWAGRRWQLKRATVRARSVPTSTIQ